MSKALIAVDIQNDFCEGGSLAVTGGLAVAHKVHDLLTGPERREFKKAYYTKDWHNPLTDNGGHFHDDPDFIDTWVNHCLANSIGSDLAADLDGFLFDDGFHKGWNEPAYSGFQGISVRNGVTTLDAALQVYAIDEIVIVGIASTHCVKATALDGLAVGYKVTVLSDMTVGVDFDGTGAAHREALAELKAAGAVII